MGLEKESYAHVTQAASSMKHRINTNLKGQRTNKTKTHHQHNNNRLGQRSRRAGGGTANNTHTGTAANKMDAPQADDGHHLKCA